MLNDKQMSINVVASFVAARLQHSIPPCNKSGGVPWISTIFVKQHKEKFGTARVYCDIAHPEMVDKTWAWLRANPSSTASRTLPKDIDLSMLAPSGAFFRICAFRDALHYRSCYLEMASLCPPMAESLCSGADHGELLCDSASSALSWIDDLSTSHTQFLRGKYHLAENESLIDFLSRVYAPSFTDFRMCRF